MLRNLGTIKRNEYEQEINYYFHLDDAAEQRPTMPRIPGIGVGNGQDLVGFRESDMLHKGVERVFPEKYNKGIKVSHLISKMESEYSCKCNVLITSRLQFRPN